MKWLKVYEHNAQGASRNGNISEVINAVHAGKRLKVLLATDESAIKSVDHIDHVIIQNGKVIIHVTHYLHPAPENSFKHVNAQRIWRTISSDGNVRIRIYDILNDTTVITHFRTGIHWFVEESVGKTPAYHSIQPDLLGKFLDARLRGNRISAIAEDDNKVYAFPMNNAFLDPQLLRRQTLHKLRQIRFPIGSFQHKRNGAKLKWFANGCWSKLGSFSNRTNEYDHSNKVVTLKDVRVVVKQHGAKSNYVINPECVNTRPDGSISANLFHYYVLGTWKKYPDHTKWECQTVSSGGIATKTKYLALMSWIVSTKTSKPGTTEWYADKTSWTLLMSVNETGKVTSGDKRFLTAVALNGASIRIAIYLPEKKSVFALRETDIFPNEYRLRANVVDCACSGNKEELGLIEIDSGGKVRVSFWDVNRRNARSAHDWINVRQEWYGRL